MPQRSRVILIGIDGLPPGVLRHCVDRGIFSTIGQIIEGGFVCDLASVRPPVTGPAWMSALTGCSPARHGVHEFLMPSERLDRLVPGTRFLEQVPSLFDVLDHNNVSGLVVNVPHSLVLAQNTSTVRVVGDLLSDDGSFCYPSELVRQYPVLEGYRQTPDGREADVSDNASYIRDIRHVERQRFEVAQTLFSDIQPRLFFYLISGSDWAMHNCYSRIFDEGSNDVHELLRDIDRYVAWFRSQMEDADHLILFSDHGFRSLDGVFSVNRWLADNQYVAPLKTSPRNDSAAGGTLHGKEIHDRRKRGISLRVPKIAIRLLNASSAVRVLASRIVGWLSRANIHLRKESLTLDIAGATAYCPTSETFGVYLNTLMRFTEGRVTDEEYDGVVSTLVAQLEDLRDLEGNPVFEWVHRNPKLQGPDIIFYPHRYQPVSRVLPAPFVRLHGYATHSETGVFIIDKPFSLRKGKEGMSLVDVLPAVCTLLGCAIPEGIDGVLPFSELDLDAKTTRYVPLRPVKRPESKQKDVDELEERLRDLGYLG